MEITTFEVLCLTFPSSHGPTTILSVYRPGSFPITSQFFKEFFSVLECIVTRNSQLVIISDFNIHQEDTTDSATIRFLDLLRQFGLLQHVKETTYLSGGILDLVITTDDTIVRKLKVQPPTISDHSFMDSTIVTFTAFTQNSYDTWLDISGLRHFPKCHSRLQAVIRAFSS